MGACLDLPAGPGIPSNTPPDDLQKKSKQSVQRNHLMTETTFTIFLLFVLLLDTVMSNFSQGRMNKGVLSEFRWSQEIILN